MSAAPAGADPIEVGPLARAEIGAAARVLTASFLDDPIATAIGPRRRGHRRLVSPLSFAAIVAASRRHGGRVLVARGRGRVVGVSIDFAPGAWPLSDGAVVYELAWALLAGPLPVRRGIAFDRMVRAAHVAHPHVYLWFLGVDPAAQGRGVGRALLASVHEAADERGVPTFLETGTIENVAYYASAGYATLGVLALPSGEPLWRMQRQACEPQGRRPGRPGRPCRPGR